MGYLLFFPLYSVPPSAIPAALVSPLRAMDAHLLNAGAGFVSLPVILFVLNLPNTLLLSVATAVALAKSALRTRPVLYSVLVLPALVYVFHWHDVWRLQRGAAALGLPTAVDSLPTNPHMVTNAVLILLSYASFFLLVFAMLRWARRRSCAHA